MMDDNLRRQLEQIDPMASHVSVDRAGSPRARALLETIMNTPIDNPSDVAGSTSSNADQGRRRRSMRLVGGLAAASLVAAVAIGVVALRNDDKAATTQALVIPGSDGGGPVMNSCIMFDVSILADMPVAFSGTVTDRTDTTATVSVDRWYKASSAGETDLVTFALPTEGLVAFEGGVDLVAGQRYFITATDGNVNGCGYSGPATPELEAAFNEAFPG